MAEKLALLRAYAPVFAGLAALLLAGMALLAALGIAIAPASLRIIGLLVAISAAALAAAGLLGGVRALGGALALALFLLIPAPLAVFSYATAALGAARPLVDAELAGLDGLIGFDWLAAVALVNQWPGLVAALGYAYHGTIIALIYVLVFLNVLGRHDRVLEFMWLVVGTCVAANVFSGLWPALGAYVHFQPGEAVRSAISSDAGVWHLGQFEALRSGAFRTLDLAATEGLVTFPSYHTAMALSALIAVRGFGPVTWFAGAGTGAVVVSTVPIGGHYLIDVLAGAALTYAVFLLVRRAAPERALEPGRRPAGDGRGALIRVLARRGRR